jgi:hypothetical protein
MSSSFELVYQDKSAALMVAETLKDTVADLLHEFIRGRPKTKGRSYKRDLQEYFALINKHFGTPRVEGATIYFSDVRRVHVVKYHNFLEETLTKHGDGRRNHRGRKVCLDSGEAGFRINRATQEAAVDWRT